VTNTLAYYDAEVIAFYSTGAMIYSSLTWKKIEINSHLDKTGPNLIKLFVGIVYFFE
jgi:hypothetical protein